MSLTIILDPARHSTITTTRTIPIRSKDSMSNNAYVTEASPEIYQDLTAIIDAVAHSSNARKFNPSYPPWNNSFSPSFRAISTSNIPGGGEQLPVYLKRMTKFCRENPDFFYTVKEARALLDGKKVTAKVLMSVEHGGLPRGIVRPGVASVEFEWEGGRWMCTRWVNIRGVEMDGIRGCWE